MVLVIPPDLRKIIEVQSETNDLVLVPGLKDSGPEHWQTIWQACLPTFSRVDQKDWFNPDIELWISAIRRHIGRSRRPAILIGHSLGALASACLGAEEPKSIAGVILVAPAEPDRFNAEERVPEVSLRVPSLVVASRNDPLMRYSRAERWAQIWGAELIDVGEAGHINAEAGYGPWLHGLDIVSSFTAKMNGAEPRGVSIRLDH
uniref:Alpha/beta hydrolase n=1 Tax=Rhodopseudomonas palustris (strain BisA53) TaxID=316055 RepID=Q07L26_RHOP5